MPGNPGAARGFDVTVPVADHEAKGGVERVLAEAAQDHARIGLAVGMIGMAKRVDRGIGVVGADIESIDLPACSGDFAGKRMIEALNLIKAELAARNTGLIGHDKHGEAGPFERSDRIGRARNNDQLGGVVWIARVHVENAVAVKKGAAAAGLGRMIAGVRHGGRLVPIGAGQRPNSLLCGRVMTDARDKFKQWLSGTALPFWIARGYDASARRFAERLDFDGTAIPDVPFRLMVQARQVASFAMAALNGYGPPETADIARSACDAMVRTYWRADGEPGWVFSADAQGAVADATRDSYAHAFVLFALSWAVRLDAPGSPVRDAYHRLAVETLAFLDTALAVPGDGFHGYRTAHPDPGGLSQNPHMHLFEALLCWFEVSGDTDFLSRANALAELALGRMIDPASGALLEFYRDGWTPDPDPAKRIVEPGHCHEWAWLLLRCGRLSGQDMLRPAERLYRFALDRGEDGKHGVFDQLLADGSLHRPGMRIWPQSEALKADAVFARLGDAEAEARIAGRIAGLFERFLDQPVPGGWIDHRDGDGAAKVGYMPASTLYHLAFTVEALDPAARTSACR